MHMSIRTQHNGLKHRRDDATRVAVGPSRRRALCRCNRSHALDHVLEIVGNCLLGKLVAVAILASLLVPRGAVVHADIAIGVLFDAVNRFELVVDLVPDLGGFPPHAEEHGRPWPLFTMTLSLLSASSVFACSTCMRFVIKASAATPDWSACSARSTFGPSGSSNTLSGMSAATKKMLSKRFSLLCRASGATCSSAH